MGLSTGETDIVGGGGFGGLGGGIGGFGLVGLIGLNTFLGQNGVSGGTGTAGLTTLEQNVSNLRQEVAQIGKETHLLGNELQMSFNASNINNANNFRALDNQLCGVNQNLANLNFAQTIQNMNNTQAIQNQASQNQIINQENFCAVKELIHTDGDATRALITQNLIDDLRNQLLQERRIRDNRETEITINNSATAVQSQLQTQNQQQQQQFAQFANLVSDQLARQTNSLVNIGGTMTGTGQSNSAAQTKVNS